VLGQEVTQKTGVITEVGLVFQDSDSQVFAPTVLDDVMFGPLNKGFTADAARLAAISALERIGAAHLTNRIPYYLSRGEKRLVAIAGVLAMNPEVIVADEPTSDLDPFHSRQIESVLFELKTDFRISIVIATHDMDLAARIADRIYVIAEGQVIATGTPRDIFYNKSVLARANLNEPTAVRLYKRLCQGGSASDFKPVKEHDLVKLLEGVIGKAEP
jgi:cobalt/nickel transport system ATP-binding protein